MSVRVFVANDHEILRGALRAVIDMQPDMEVVGEAGTGPDTELAIQRTEVDVVLMDLSVPNGGGLDAIAAVKRIRSKARVIVLTFQEELGYIRAGGRRRADGYVMKRKLNTELLSAIRAVAPGRTFTDASIEPKCAQRSTRREPHRPANRHRSPRARSMD